MGIPAIIFASVVGTAIFAGLEKNSPKAPWVAFASISAAVLTALQTFLRFSERAAEHATAGDWYSAIRRDVEQILHLPVDCRGQAKDCLDEVRKEMNPRGPGRAGIELAIVEARSQTLWRQGADAAYVTRNGYSSWRQHENTQLALGVVPSGPERAGL